MERTKPRINEDRADRPPLAVVLMGASNLSLALPGILRHAVRRAADRELEVWVAHGPGRSYGVEAGVMGVRFTGISRSGLIDALAERVRNGEARRLEVRALLTDIGNDILYRSGVERTLTWIRRIVDGLLALGGRVGVTSLPLESVESIPSWKFRMLRPVFFPFRPMRFAEVLSQAQRIQEGLEKLGREVGVRVLDTRTDWYGFDHFHLRARLNDAAFRVWLDAVLGESEPEGADGMPGPSSNGLPSLPGGLRLRCHPPAEYSLFGRRVRNSRIGWRIAPHVRLYGF